MAVTAEDISRFWIEEVGQSRWYVQEDALDESIRQRFLPAWEAAFAGNLDDWCQEGTSLFGFLILTDQFPRNMFRGDERAFATDALARTAAKTAIHRRWDLALPEPERQFFYLPLMHSEDLADQDACIRLMNERMPQGGAKQVLHAKVHRKIIRRFGRFPYRNVALGRMTLPTEQAFLENEGYGSVLREIQATP
ncbi:DUF924 family protein [Tropicimonas sp. TH_r6]|uniref:DUF924 family protein n=1 Tax=Tropicimonas sp. TH_r6 TaxID=3082085 RepID=UPI002953FE7B|nr:DUF924 family protein [Tropicimonas sp. TH_r6]MDV7143350.1 DUF924 family protein [Tropicimonas sp. TH_r6]